MTSIVVHITILVTLVFQLLAFSGCAAREEVSSRSVTQVETQDSYAAPEQVSRVEVREKEVTRVDDDDDDADDGLFGIIGNIVALPFRAVGGMLSAIF